MRMKPGVFLLITAVLGSLCTPAGIVVVQAKDNPAQDRPQDQPREEGGVDDAGSGSLNTRDSIRIWDGHGASTGCAQCHGNRPEHTSADTVKLVAPVPQLCFSCHKEYASLDGWVHGPVAMGDCLFCHDSHGSGNGSLLAKPVPGLCRQCHTGETLQPVKGHTDASHQSCDDCHESHAGSNRMLLKQTFLDTEAGTPYRDLEVFQRPRYTLVDRRGSLAGLKGVRVILAIERQDLLSPYGLTPDLVKTEVERCLRQRGIRILSDEGQAPGQPGLYVCLRLVELRLPGYSNEVGALSGTVSLFLRQMVELTLQPNDAERRLCVAATWDTSAIVVWGIPQLQEGFTDATKVLVDRFCSDYLAANPSDRQSISGGGALWNPEHRVGK